MYSHSIAVFLLGLFAAWATGCTNEVEPLAIGVDPSEIIKVEGLPPPLKFSETLGKQMSDGDSITFLAVGYFQGQIARIQFLELYKDGTATLKFEDHAFFDPTNELRGRYRVQDDEALVFSFGGDESINTARFQIGKNTKRMTLVPFEMDRWFTDQAEFYQFQKMTKELSDVSRLEEFAGEDVRRLPEEQYQEVQLLAANLFVGDDPIPGWPIETKRIWKPKSGDVHLILYQGSGLYKRPGSSIARLLLLDENGVVLNQQDFSVYRQSFVEAEFFEPEGEFSYVRIDAEDGTQFIAIQDYEFHLVRNKNYKGLVIPDGKFGHHVERIPNEQWTKRIHSSNRLELLKTLTAEPEWPLKLIYEDKEAKPIVKRLTSLTKSDDKWIQEAAATYLGIFKESENYAHLISKWRSSEWNYSRSNERLSTPEDLKSNSCD